ncbi:hypothetical protein BDZ45DRAFT_405086 [Acephala macrosclerotiorum]|nr:hypothetical protein BDZ45DRAFT_405086 [Acephala macrosclerotiorum]
MKHSVRGQILLGTSGVFLSTSLSPSSLRAGGQLETVDRSSTVSLCFECIYHLAKHAATFISYFEFRVERSHDLYQNPNSTFAKHSNIVNGCGPFQDCLFEIRHYRMFMRSRPAMLSILCRFQGTQR